MLYDSRFLIWKNQRDLLVGRAELLHAAGTQLQNFLFMFAGSLKIGAEEAPSHHTARNLCKKKNFFSRLEEASTTTYILTIRG